VGRRELDRVREGRGGWEAARGRGGEDKGERERERE